MLVPPEKTLGIFLVYEIIKSGNYWFNLLCNKGLFLKKQISQVNYQYVIQKIYLLVRGYFTGYLNSWCKEDTGYM